jgi:hypothetical protein
MNIYYTAKDMEELAAKGVTRLEIGPRVFLTDFAYETAEQLEIELIQIDGQNPIAGTASPQGKAAVKPHQESTPGRYNKPAGCQHDRVSTPASRNGAGSASPASNASTDGASVNRLIDIMGKIIKRGD